jgi:hypothetical protein
LSITQAGSFVETRLLAVALNQADSKQRNKIFIICIECATMERELNKEKKWIKKDNYIAISRIWIPILLLILYLFSL